MDLCDSNTPSILVLKGVTFSDIPSVDDIFDRCNDERIAEYTQMDDHPETSSRSGKYEKIPSYFEGIESWPKHTNIRCWSCTRIFDGIPVFVPTNIRSEDGIKPRIKTEGNFCTFGCASTYIRNYCTGNKWQKLNNLCTLYTLFNPGCKITSIPSNPTYIDIEEYGGDYTLEHIKNDILRNEQTLLLTSKGPAEKS